MLVIMVKMVIGSTWFVTLGVLGACAVTSSRCDSALDCFHAGYFKRSDWAATCAWAASCAEARSVCVGALFSPAARGGRGPDELTTSSIWNGCSELGTLEHIC